MEKGGYTPAHELTWREEDGFGTMYERGGLLVSQSGGQVCGCETYLMPDDEMPGQALGFQL